MVSFDSSALIKRYQREDHSEWVREIMSRDPDWCGSMLLATETAIAAARNATDARTLSKVDSRLSIDLDQFSFVAVDSDCLVSAVEIGRGHDLRTLDAIHLAAAKRLPPGCRFITFDQKQAGAALDLGLELLAPA